MESLNRSYDFVETLVGNTPAYSRDRYKAIPLASGAYADKAARRFPIDSKNATYRSYCHALVTGANEPVVKTIEQAGRAYGISDDLQKVAGAIALRERGRSDYQKVASALDRAERPSGLALPNRMDLQVIDPLEIQKTAQKVMSREFLQNTKPSDVQKAASNIVAAARYFAMQESQIPRWIQKTAGNRFIDETILNIQLNRRKERAPAAFHPVYDSMKEAAQVRTSTMDEGLALADTLFEADKCARINGMWGDGALLYPLDTVMSGVSEDEFQKIASSMIELNGVQVPVEAIANIPSGEIVRAFDGAGVEKIATIFDFERDMVAAHDAAAALEPVQQQVLLELAAKHAKR